MGQSDKDLERLDGLLEALPQDDFPMTLSKLDGYLTGILACPVLIPPSDWLSQVWGESGKTKFLNTKAADETIGAVMARYNAIASDLLRSPYVEPIYEIDQNSDEVLWESWVQGFTRAMSLRDDAWTALLDRADEETQTTMIFLLALQDINEGKSKFSEEEIEDIDLEAPDLIPNCVATILKQSRPELFLRQAANSPDRPFRASDRPGRNDPCSCGSGRKNKTCCGKN